MSHFEEIEHDVHDRLYAPTVLRVTGDDPNEVIMGFVDAGPPSATPTDAPPPTDAEPESTESEVGEAPPKSGAGSGREEWATYATSLGLTVTDAMSRDDIINLVEST